MTTFGATSDNKTGLTTTPLHISWYDKKLYAYFVYYVPFRKIQYKTKVKVRPQLRESPQRVRADLWINIEKRSICPTNYTLIHILIFAWVESLGSYRKTSSISRTKSPNWNVSCILLQFCSLNPLKPGVKLRMKMSLEQRRQAMLQLHLNYQQFYCLLRCDLY